MVSPYHTSALLTTRATVSVFISGSVSPTASLLVRSSPCPVASVWFCIWFIPSSRAIHVAHAVRRLSRLVTSTVWFCTNPLQVRTFRFHLENSLLFLLAEVLQHSHGTLGSVASEVQKLSKGPPSSPPVDKWSASSYTSITVFNTVFCRLWLLGEPKQFLSKLSLKNYW